MTARDFCYWLQGYFEIHGKGDNLSLTADQTACIRRHLSLAFVHDIDPQAGGPEKQAVLNKIHESGEGPPGVVYRC